MLRAKPALGRVFTEAECRPGHDAVIVLSYGFAQSHFGSPQNALGQQLELNGRNHQVIGIMPEWFHVTSWFPSATQGWIPIAWTDKERAIRGNHNWQAVARLRDGVSMAKAQSAMDVLSDRLARDYPEENKGWGASVITLRDNLVGDVRARTAHLAGRGRLRPADRMRQYGEPCARPHDRAAKGARDPRSARRQQT